MNTPAFTIVIADTPETDYCFAEIWYCDNIVAMVDYEEGPVRIRLFKPPDADCWTLPYEPFIEAVHRARNRLGPRVNPFTDRGPEA